MQERTVEDSDQMETSLVSQKCRFFIIAIVFLEIALIIVIVDGDGKNLFVIYVLAIEMPYIMLLPFDK